MGLKMDILQLVLLNNAILVIIAIVFLRVLSSNLPKTIENYKLELKKELEMWLNSETGAKALYQIGALIGHGASTGLGIQKTGGKFKWENLLGDIVTSYLKGKNPLSGLGASTPEKNLTQEEIKELPRA